MIDLDDWCGQFESVLRSRNIRIYEREPLPSRPFFGCGYRYSVGGSGWGVGFFVTELEVELLEPSTYASRILASVLVVAPDSEEAR